MSNWPIRKLGEVITLNYGKGIPESDRDKDGKNPIYGANGILGWTDKFLIEGEGIIVGRKGSAGEVNRVKGKFWPSDVTYYILEDKKTDIDYVYYLLKYLNLPRLAKGVKPGVNRNDVYEIKVPVPGIEEQKRIVKKLEKILVKIEEANALRHESIEEAIKLKRSAISKILNEKWTTKTLKEISTNLDSKRKPVTQSIREKGEYPYYGASGIVDYVKNYIFDEDLLLVSEDGANLFARTYPIAFPISGKTWVNNHAHVLKFENKSTQKFTEYYFNSIDISSYISGTAQPKLNQENLNKIQIPIPDLEEQEKIVAYLDNLSEKVQALQKLQQEQLQDLEALKQSVLHRAFQGEL